MGAKSRAAVLNLLALGILLILHLRLFEYSFDDAYIHFRIARNFYHTGEPYYNNHEPIQTSSSPAWTILTTIIYGISSKVDYTQFFPQVIAIFNACVTLTGANMAYLLFRQILPNASHWRAGLLAGLAFVLGMLPASLGLMETPTAMLLALGGLYFLISGDRRGYLLLGVAVFFRLELFILWGVSFLFFSRKFGPRPADLAYSAVGTLPFILYQLYFFRTLLPHTIIAKNKAYTITTLDSFTDIITSAPRYARLDWFDTPKAAEIAAIPFSVLFLFALVINMKSILRDENDPSTVFSLWGVGIMCGYVVGHAFIFDWYMPQYFIPTAFAAILLLARENLRYRPLLQFTSMILFMFQVIGLGQTALGAVYNPSFYPGFSNGARVRQYLVIGEALQREYPDTSLLTAEIGALGYAFEGYIHDAAGLASPAALAYHPMKIPEERLHGWIAAIPPGYVESANPEIIVSYDIFAQALLNSKVKEQYERVVIPSYLPDDAGFTRNAVIFGSRFIRVYIRKDLAVTPEILKLGLR